MKFNSIDEIMTTKPKKWALQVRVSRSWMAIHPFKDVVLHKGFILLDGKGDDIWAQIPVFLLDKFTNLMVDRKTYSIYQFKVLAAPKEYRPISNKFIIQFSALTTIEEIPDIPSIPYYKFSFIRETEIGARCENPTLLSDVMGHVIHYTKTQVGSSTLPKTITLKLTENCQVQLCLWNRFAAMMDEVIAANANKPLVLIATSVYIRLRNGKPVFYASSATQLCGNLQIPEVVHFFNWYASKVTAPILNDPSDIAKSPVVTIEKLNDLTKDSNNQNNYYIVECTIKGLKNGWCYFGCSNCPKKVEEGVDEYFCCRSVRTETALRYRVQLQVSDNTAEADLVILDSEGQKWIGETAQTLFEFNGQNSSIPPQKISILVGKELKVQVQVNRYNISNTRNEFTVTKILAGPNELDTVPPMETVIATSYPSSESISSSISVLGTSQPPKLTGNDATEAAVEQGATDADVAATDTAATDTDVAATSDLGDDTTMAAMQKTMKKRKKESDDSNLE